jgi:hypothetical protein
LTTEAIANCRLQIEEEVGEEGTPTLDPVRVKVYGLMSMTRRGYLMQLAGAVVLVIVLLAFRLLRWPDIRPDPNKVNEHRLRYMILCFDNIHWFVGIVAVLLTIEAWLVLRRFSRKEAERSNEQPAKPG